MNRVHGQESARLLLPVVFLILLAFLLVSPLWQQEGIPHTADGHFHLHRSAAMQRSLEQSVFWPRWFPDASHGRGEPTFHYYSPGLYWLIGAFHWTGIGLDLALTRVISATFVLSGLGVYAWLRYLFSPTASLAAATVYLGLPHVYSRTFLSSGDYPQLLTFLLFPLCLWAVTDLFRQARLRAWTAAVLSIAALILGHQQQALIGAGVLTLYCLLLAAGYRKLDGLARCSAAGLLALLLTAAFWLPSIGDLSLVQMAGALEDRGYFGNHFLTWKTLFSAQPFVWDARAGNPLALPHNTFGTAQWLLAAAGLVGGLFMLRDRERLIWCIAGILCSLGLLTLTVRASGFLWESVPGLPLLQYPFRLLPAAVLGVLPAAAVAVDIWPSRWRWLPSTVTLLAAAAFPFPYLFPDLASQTTIVSTTSLSAEDSRRRGVGVEHFLPIDADRDIMFGLKAEPQAVELTWHSPHEAVADISGQTGPILLRQHFHPGWSIGERGTLSPGAAGFMQVTDVRRLNKPLVIRWEGTDWQLRGERLSLLGLLICLGGILLLLRGKYRPATGDGATCQTDRGPCRSTELPQRGHFILVGLVFSLVFLRYSITWFGSFPFLYDSPPGRLAFSARGEPVTLGVSGGNQMTLLGWDLLSGTRPRPGDTIVLRLFWQPEGKITEELSSFVHLYTPAFKRSWAVENRGVFRSSVKIWSPEDYYIETMHLLVPADIPPVTYSLVAGLVNSSGERMAVPGSSEGLLNLQTMSVSPLRTGLFQRQRPETRASADTADNLRLQGFDLLPAHGEQVLRLFWEAKGEVASDWTTYIHLFDPYGERIAQFDGPALAGLKPTSDWQPRELYIDRRHLNLPRDLLAGAYLLRIGLYSLENGERLPFQSDNDAQNRFENGQLLVPLTLPEK